MGAALLDLILVDLRLAMRWPFDNCGGVGDGDVLVDMGHGMGWDMA